MSRGGTATGNYNAQAIYFLRFLRAWAAFIFKAQLGFFILDRLR
jgi:hypothetical protein